MQPSCEMVNFVLQNHVQLDERSGTSKMRSQSDSANVDGLRARRPAKIMGPMGYLEKGRLKFVGLGQISAEVGSGGDHQSRRASAECCTVTRAFPSKKGPTVSENCKSTEPLYTTIGRRLLYTQIH